MSNRALLLLLLGAATVSCSFIVLSAIWHNRHASPYLGGYKPITMAEEKTIATQTLLKWKEGKYIPVRNSAEFTNSLNGLFANLEHRPMMSPTLASKLVEAIGGFIAAFGSGDYNAYRDFRLPAGFDCTITPTGTNRINDYFVKLPPLRPVSYEFYDYWHLHYLTDWHPRNMTNWHSRYETNWPDYKTNKFQAPSDINQKFQRLLYDYSGRNFYSNYFAAICFDNLVVMIDRYDHTVPPLKGCHFPPSGGALGFAFSTTNFPSLVYCDLGEDRFRLFNIYPTLDNVLTQEKSVLCANCLLFVRIQCPEETYKPFLVRFYWVDAPQKWLVDDVIDANFFTATNCNYLVVF